MSSYILPLIAGGSLMFFGFKVNEYEMKQTPRKAYYGQFIFVIGYGFCWAFPMNAGMRLGYFLRRPKKI